MAYDFLFNTQNTTQCLLETYIDFWLVEIQGKLFQIFFKVIFITNFVRWIYLAQCEDKNPKRFHLISAQETFHFLEAFLLFISSSDLPRGFGLCLFPVTSSKHWIPLVTTPTWTYINISSGLTNLNWKWKDIDQNVQKSEVLEKVPFHFDINLFWERLGQFSFR